jgi:MraZ protein
MSSFKGKYSYSVDEKGRIALPARLRKNVASSAKGNFVITRGFEKCLYVYPQDEWNILEQNFRTLSFLDAKQRNFNRTLFAWATDSQLDSQSRITVQQDLLDYAGIKNEVVVIGVLNRIELWSSSVYDEFQKIQPETYETVAEQAFKQQ